MSTSLTTAARKQLLAQAYLDIIVANPKVKRKKALKIMNERGYDLKSVQDITRITSSLEWKALYISYENLARAKQLAALAKAVPKVIEHQQKIALGQVKASMPQVTAARTLISASGDMLNNAAAQPMESGAGTSINITNHYYSPIPDKIVEGQVDFDPQTIKSAYTDKAGV